MADLITRTDFTAYVDIGANVPTINITRSVGEAQEIDLRPILTPDFYDEVIEVSNTGVDAVSGNLTKANYDTLLPYLQKCLIYYAYANFLIGHNTNSTAFGLVVKETPYSSPVSNSVITAQVKSFRSKAIEYVARLEKFLEENLADYTTYKNSQEAPKKAGNSAGIWSI